MATKMWEICISSKSVHQLQLALGTRILAAHVVEGRLQNTAHNSRMYTNFAVVKLQSLANQMNPFYIENQPTKFFFSFLTDNFKNSKSVGVTYFRPNL
jgi:hypothetical protein